MNFFVLEAEAGNNHDIDPKTHYCQINLYMYRDMFNYMRLFLLDVVVKLTRLPLHRVPLSQTPTKAVHIVYI